MNTAMDIALNTRSNIERLRHTYRTLKHLFDAISRQSGVSESGIRKFYYGTKPNPSVIILDRMTAGVNALVERRL